MFRRWEVWVRYLLPDNSVRNERRVHRCWTERRARALKRWYDANEDIMAAFMETFEDGEPIYPCFDVRRRN